GKTMASLLAEFAVVRADSLNSLQRVNLTPEALALRGTHPAFGCVTMQQLLSTWVVHDLSHTRQIVRSMAYQYRDDVGPWLPNLAILRGD
ncbi:MAG: DinB family protein, partial [Pirellulaceae bacterium]